LRQESDRRREFIYTESKYTDTQMSSKTISLKEETYERLRRAKGDDESFSDAIDRLLGSDEHPLFDLVGLLDDEEVDRVRDRADAFRENVDDRMGGAEQ
jgi:predicted CopG family antitoxin